jgi:hypothetical protein
MHHGHRTLVSTAPRQRRIWPWLLLLLVVAVGASFAGVLAFLSYKASTAPAQAVASTSAPVVAASDAQVATAPPATLASNILVPHASGAPPLHVGTPAAAATTASTHTPPASAPIGPASAVSPMATPGSGTRILSGLSDAEDCGDASLSLDTGRNGVNACIQQFRFDPPVHENTGYIVWFETAGTVSNVERMTHYPAVPRLDACIADALRQVKLGKQKQRCYWHVEYGAPCVPGWFGQCATVGAAASASNAASSAHIIDPFAPQK